MATLLRVRGGSDASPLGVVSQPEWHGFTRGEVVRISGRKGHYTFYEHTRTQRGAEWVTVYGGSKHADGTRQFVSVLPDRIHKTKQPERRRK